MRKINNLPFLCYNLNGDKMIKYGNINKNNGYIEGILYGIMGGILFSLPWIVINRMLGFVSVIFAALITYGVIKGYRLSNSRIDSNMRKIVIILTIFIIVLINLIILPLLEMGNFKFIIDYLLINKLYVIKELIISILFGIIGIKYTFDRFYI